MVLITIISMLISGVQYLNSVARKEMTSMEKLKPCPFCGGGAVLRKGQRYLVLCKNAECRAYISTVDMSTPEEAIKIWNHRPGEADAYRRGVQRMTLNP